MKYQALRPHFFSMVGWGVVGWGGEVGGGVEVVGWVEEWGGEVGGGCVGLWWGGGGGSWGGWRVG